ncbi:MAG: amidohydrolase family protein, partial [Bacteroidota bacterium]|nr:amidohydrolase family protein [Bacteroidota bacterium]
MAPRTSLKISNGRLITPKGITSPGSLLIAGGQIASWSEGDLDAGDVPVLDARGLYVAPGFVDIHIHGMGGYDFMDQDVEGFREISRLLPRYGTTAIFPTTLTGSTEETLSTLSVYQKAIQSLPAGAEFMGIHLEGPYFAMNQRGAQDPRYIRNPDPAEYHLIIESSPHIRRWSAAPELPGFIPFAQFAVSKGLVVSMAHTDAIYEEVWAAYEAGCRLATHLYSGMSGVTRRNAYRYA